MSSDPPDDESRPDLPVDAGDSGEEADSSEGYGLETPNEPSSRRPSPTHLLGSARIRPIGSEHEIEPKGTKGTYSLAGDDPPEHVPIEPPTPRRGPRVVEDDDSTPSTRAQNDSSGERRTRKRRSTWRDFRARMSCNLIVFVSSLCVMVLELTASRLIANDVGQSLYTWTSVIGVVLAGITLGNLLGGWLADRIAPRTLIPSLLFASSILCVGVLLLDETITGMDRGAMDWQTWIVFVASTLFLPPAIALGTIAPPVAALALRHSVRDGATVGNVYAWGALGSIVGTFLTGFYLVDHLGSRSIVWLTSGTLAATAALCAAGMWAFRAAICLGWLQFLTFVGLSASATQESLAGWGRWIGSGLSIGLSEETRSERTQWWSEAFGALGADIRQLGLTLRLRDDADPDEYRDESNYALIRVDWDRDGTKVLRIDKLIHSRWDPAVPIRPQARYERIYTGVTEAAAVQRDVWTEAGLGTLPLGCTPEDLPDYARYDPETKLIAIHGALSNLRFDELLRLSDHASYLSAVRSLTRASQTPSRTGFTEVAVEALPEGTSLVGLDGVVHDRVNGQLRTFHPVDDDLYAAMLDLSPDGEYVRVLERLLTESRTVRAFFIGGGGFVMPRWIEARFPGESRIDVAELDPAVVLAARREFGLPPPAETRIETHIGDARQIVADLLRDASPDDSRPSYDFVYGDAFNDFGVPWHLTTAEFAEMVRALLAEDGVYLVNLIDQVPRTEFPTDGEAYAGRVPSVLAKPVDSVGVWTACPPPFVGLELRNDGTAAEPEYRFAIRAVMSAGVREELLAAAEGNPLFAELVEELFRRSRRLERGRFLGRFTATLADVFPHVYVFSGAPGQPASARDTLVVVGAKRPLDLSDDVHLGQFWPGRPFAWRVTDDNGGETRTGGMWEAVIGLAEGERLTDDFAPVDNLLLPLLTEGSAR